MSLNIGFYQELVELQQDDKNASFSFLKNIDVTKEASARKYLHGHCDEFAAMLSDVFGYEIEAVRNAEGRLIHAYCVSKIGEQKVYIDVRGITTDTALFFEEFKYQVTYYAPTGEFLVIDEEGCEVNAEIESWACKDELFEGEYQGWEDKEVIDFINSFAGYYDVDKYISIDERIEFALKQNMDTLTDHKDKNDIER